MKKHQSPVGQYQGCTSEKEVDVSPPQIDPQIIRRKKRQSIVEESIVEEYQVVHPIKLVKELVVCPKKIDPPTIRGKLLQCPVEECQVVPPIKLVEQSVDLPKKIYPPPIRRKQRQCPVEEHQVVPPINKAEQLAVLPLQIEPQTISTRMGDEVDGGTVGHVADDSFNSWFAARMNRNRNEERNVHVGGSVLSAALEPGNVNLIYKMGYYQNRLLFN